jgi:diguanylate cyclase (GGDEF)-like protein
MGERVLVVEDEPDVAETVRLVLQRAGYEVTVLADGLEAVEWVIRERPAAVVLDVALPGIDGFEVLARIRRDHRTMHTVVILLTGRTGAADRASGWDLEPDDYVLKPFDPDDLLARLSGRLRRLRAALATSWAMLPGGTAIERHVRRLLDDDVDFALHHLDVDEFKAFNGRYGYVRGNEAIALVARIVESVAGDPAAGAFAGHVGGDDFVLVTAPSVAVQAAREVIERFDRAVPALYDDIDRAAGFVSVQDRSRTVGRHRIMTISIGIASTAVRRFGHYGQVAQVAAEMLAIAKRAPWSSFAIDRRTSDDLPR